MGKIYKRKRRSCPFCKPHKTGGSDKKKAKVRAKETAMEADIRDHLTK